MRFFSNAVQIGVFNYLRTLENTTTPPCAYNAYLLQIFTNYFACFEQFVSTLYALVSFYKLNTEAISEFSLHKYFKKDYKHAITTILSAIDADKIAYNKTGLTNKISELECARNYILHGNIGEIKTEKTHLPSFPLSINAEDIMEEIDIIINFINYFRYILPDIDLMPNIRIFLDKTLYWEKFDLFFYNIVCSYFDKVLGKHSLKKSRSYSLTTNSLQTFNNDIVHKLIIIIKALPRPQYKTSFHGYFTTDYFNDELNKNIPPERRKHMADKFMIPRFMVRNNRH